MSAGDPRARFALRYALHYALRYVLHYALRYAVASARMRCLPFVHAGCGASAFFDISLRTGNSL